MSPENIDMRSEEKRRRYVNEKLERQTDRQK